MKVKGTPRPFIKIKRLSRKKKMILMGREIKKRIRWKWERNETHVALVPVVTIDLGALKITADPEIDIDYVRGVSVMSMYERNYRSPVGENISECSVHMRPDVTYRLNNLDINDEDEVNCNLNVPQENYVGFDILQSISYLRINENNEPDINERIRNMIVSEDVNK